LFTEEWQELTKPRGTALVRLARSIEDAILADGKTPSMWSHMFIVVDIVSMKVFLWALGKLRRSAVDPSGGILDSHLFFYDRYADLAEHHRLRGRIAKARRFTAVAEAYYELAPDDDEPPKAGAMAVPVPRRPLNTNAVSTQCPPTPRPEKPTALLPSLLR
jgi:hypothetical protein